MGGDGFRQTDIAASALGWLVDVERCSSDPSAAPVRYIFKWGALFLPAQHAFRTALYIEKRVERERFV